MYEILSAFLFVLLAFVRMNSLSMLLETLFRVFVSLTTALCSFMLLSCFRAHPPASETSSKDTNSVYLTFFPGTFVFFYTFYSTRNATANNSLLLVIQSYTIIRINESLIHLEEY